MNFKEYFELSKKELNGLIVLCILLVLMGVAPALYHTTLTAPVVNTKDSNFEKEVDQFLASVEAEDDRRNFNHSNTVGTRPKSEVQYFSFNPNHLSESDWLRLGLSPRQIGVIKNYEAKGGRFYKKEDLKKIYSITEYDYSRLLPYIHIPPGSENKARYERAPFKKERSLVDINLADSSELESLKGIGPAFARRIVKYRNRLGGFWRKEQLLEVYGLDSVKYRELEDQIMISSKDVQKIDINSAGFNDLKKYPYLNYKQINAIIQYRNQHGKYQSIEDLNKVLILSADVVAKLAPYLNF